MVAKSQTDISIVIPAKDEEKRLPAFLLDLISFCQGSSYNYEIIVVDDGSQDRTSDIVKTFQPKFDRLHLIRLRQNRGKGFAVKTGVWHAQGKIILFLDADGSTTAQEIESNLHLFDQGYDIVIGSRVLNDGAHAIKVKPYRKVIGQIFNFFVHVFLLSNVKDTQCGFKMFKRETIRPIFSRQNIKGFGFDLEVLYLAQKLEFKIKEVSINWHHVDESKTNLFTDSIRMFINIFQIRSWHIKESWAQIPHMSDQEIKAMYDVEKEHWWFQSKNALIQHLVKKSNRVYNRILDAGCGTGLNLAYLTKYGSCFGCDAVHQALKFCQKNNVKDIARCHLEGLSFKDGMFDLITVLDVIEHVESPADVLQQLKSKLTKDGAMIITVPAFKFLWSQHDEALSHYRRYHKDELNVLLMDAGYHVDKIGYYFCFPFIMAVPIRICKRILRKKGSIQSDTTHIPHKNINRLLNYLMALELKIHSILPLPFGTTLYAVVQKGSMPVNVSTLFQESRVNEQPHMDPVTAKN